MQYELKTYTTAGLALLASGETSSITFTKLLATNQAFTPNADLTILKQGDFKNAQVYTINSQTSQENIITTATNVTNKGFATDYPVYAWGLVGKVGDNEQLVKVITTAGTDILILPKYDSSAPVNLTVTDQIILANAGDHVTVTSNPGAFAIDSMVVHNTGDESIDGQKDFKEMPTVNGVPISHSGGVVDLTTDQKILGIKNFAGELQSNGKDVATDDSVVHLTGDEEVGGNKTFDNVPAVKTKGSLATEKYVDAATTVKADDSNTVHKSGDEEVTGTKTFDMAPVNKSDGKPYITATAQQPQDSKETADVQDGSTAWVRLAKGTEGLPDANNAYDVRTINAGGNLVQQALTEAIPDTIYQRTFTSGGHWTDWHAVGSVPDDVAKLDQDANFIGKLQKGGKDVTTSDDVTTAMVGFYHQNSDDASAKSAAQAATTPGIYWYPAS